MAAGGAGVGGVGPSDIIPDFIFPLSVVIETVLSLDSLTTAL
jgi:hypothetical protein